MGFHLKKIYFKNWCNHPLLRHWESHWDAGVLVRKWVSKARSAKLSGLSVFHHALWNQLLVSPLWTPAYHGLRVPDSRLRPNQTLVSCTLAGLAKLSRLSSNSLNPRLCTRQVLSRKLKSCYVARNRFQEPSLELSSQATLLACRYDNPMLTWFLAPIAGLKLPSQERIFYNQPFQRACITA